MRHRPASLPIVVLLTLTILIAVSPFALADYSAHDPQEASQKHLDLKVVSSHVYRGSYGSVRTKLVRLNATFYDTVNWLRLRYPTVYFDMDSFGGKGLDYRLEMFYLRPAGGGKKQLHCWLEHWSTGNVVLFDRDMKAFSDGASYATCTFPKLAMKVRSSGRVRWEACVLWEIR